MDNVITRTTICKRDGEYHVRAYNRTGQRIPDADYFTDDKQDAADTAAVMTVSRWQVTLGGAWIDISADDAAWCSAHGVKLRLI